MPSKKQRRRDKRRAEKLVEEAFETAQRENWTLAERLMIRALDLGPHNARFWKEFGELCLARGERARAEGAFRRALDLSPNYDEARDLLAGSRGEPPSLGVIAENDDEPGEPPGVDPVSTERTRRYDWSEVERHLVKSGLAVLPALLDTTECCELRELFSDDQRFEHDVSIDDEKGRLAYRFFRRPFPAPLPHLRRELYARVVLIANRFNELLGESARFPPTLEGFARRCHRAGQRRTAAVLFHYTMGGFNGYHRDVVGDVFFPLQCAISLGPSGRDDGGELALLDVRPGRKRHFKQVSTDPGDAVLFCTRDRLCPIAGLYGLQPVLHGVTEVREERYSIGLPFHEYAGD